MIQYKKEILGNGLTLITHEDASTPLATINILYKVGARDENPNLTGFAHLFEHLMFGGSPNYPDYDLVVNGFGGESNAYTNNDYTNYYLTFPANALEEALKLEADRMRTLAFSEESLRVQQNVVTEEYNQRYMNQPYGDIWLLLRPLCYQTHPYRWSTIGSTIEHVKQAQLSDVKEFFSKHYHPSNAIISIAGNILHDETVALVKKHFGSIPTGTTTIRNLPQELEPTAPRSLTVHRNVPNDSLYKAYLMCDRFSNDYYAHDILSDILSNGKSSRLNKALVIDQRLFSETNAYITGDIDAGLFVVSGKLCDGVDIHIAEQAIETELQRIATSEIDDKELQKVVNKFESTFVFSQYKAADRAASLCYYDMLGHLEWVNDEPNNYKSITTADVRRIASRLFKPERCCTLYYLSNNSSQS